LPGSGKSTIARIVTRSLLRHHRRTQLLSVEMLRKVLTPDPRYSEEERAIVYGTLVFIAKLLTQNDVNVVIDATANRRKYRDAARASIGRFAEVYLKCPLQVCMRREMRRKNRSGAPSMIYLKAKTGDSRTVPGVGVPYEEPVSPEIILDTSKLKPSKCADRVLGMIKTRFG
jgi:adenylylsulfate kinase